MHDVKTAVVILGIGQLNKAQLEYFKRKINYFAEIFNKPLEFLSLTGNICTQEKDYIIHLHSVLMVVVF